MAKTPDYLANDDDADDLHTKLMKEIWLYCHWQERFHRYGYKESAANAKRCLRNIRNCATARQKEIHKVQQDLIKAARAQPTTLERDPKSGKFKPPRYKSYTGKQKKNVK